MKIGVFSDVHANLPALKKALEIFKKEKCAKIVHVGDLISIGPHPKECMDLAMQQSDMIFIMGNHDHWYAYGLPNPIPSYMSEEEVAHQKWVHQQIGDAYKAQVQQWRFSTHIHLENGHLINFRHYGLNKEKNWFASFLKNPTDESLEELFHDVEANTIFYGHNHTSSHHHNDRQFINLGSAGCWDKPVVRLGILEPNSKSFFLKKLYVPYEDDGLMEDYEKRHVPAREFITNTFLTR